MKKNIPLALILLLCLSCSKQGVAKELQAKNKTIDSLQNELRDCKSQAQIMADVLENERIEQQIKKAKR